MSERQDHFQSTHVSVSHLNFTPKQAPNKRIISSRSLRKESPGIQNSLNKGIDSSPIVSNVPNTEMNRRSSRLRKKTAGLASECFMNVNDGNFQSQGFVSDSNQNADFSHENCVLQKSGENLKAASTNDKQTLPTDPSNPESAILEDYRLEKRSQESFSIRQQIPFEKSKTQMTNQFAKEITNNANRYDFRQDELNFDALAEDPVVIQERNQWLITVLKAILFNNKFGKHISCNKVRFKAKILMRKIGPQTIKSCKIFSLERELSDETYYNKMSTTKIQCFQQLPRVVPPTESNTISEPEIDHHQAELQPIVPAVEETQHPVEQQPEPEPIVEIPMEVVCSPEIVNSPYQEPTIEAIPDQNYIEEALEDCCLIAQTVSPEGLRCELRSIVREDDDFYTFQLLINQQNKIISSQKVRLGQLMREQRDMAFRFMLEEFWKMKERYEEFIGSFCIFAQRIGDVTIRADK